MSHASFVQVQGLRKQYTPPTGAFAVGPKEGISFEIQSGEIFSLLGPNGAGKSTTINMMCSLISPTAGDIIIGGHSVTQTPLAAKTLMGVVPQDLALYPTLSAQQNLEFFGQMYGLGGKLLRQRLDEVLEVIGLRDRAKEKIETYSGGMKRRVNIGVGLMHQPKMLFLDEPTVAIDPQSRRSILDTVKILNEAGMTILYTTHYMEEAEELSDRVGIIDHGQIIALGTIGELTRQVGERDTLIFKAPGVTDEQTAKLKNLEGVEEVSFDPSTEELQVIASRGRKLLPRLIATLDEAGLPLNSIEIREPNLEAVFLHLTGRALRD